jgi:hypothetical protein
MFNNVPMRVNTFFRIILVKEIKIVDTPYLELTK